MPRWRLSSTIQQSLRVLPRISLFAECWVMVRAPSRGGWAVQGQPAALGGLQSDTPRQRRGWACSPPALPRLDPPCQAQAPPNPGTTQLTRELTRPSRRCSSPWVAVSGDARGGESSTEQLNPAKERWEEENHRRARSVTTPVPPPAVISDFISWIPPRRSPSGRGKEGSGQL